jgi:hypothetical protein
VYIILATVPLVYDRLVIVEFGITAELVVMLIVIKLLAVLFVTSKLRIVALLAKTLFVVNSKLFRFCIVTLFVFVLLIVPEVANKFEHVTLSVAKLLTVTVFNRTFVTLVLVLFKFVNSSKVVTELLALTLPNIPLPPLKEVPFNIPIVAKGTDKLVILELVVIVFVLVKSVYRFDTVIEFVVNVFTVLFVITIEGVLYVCTFRFVNIPVLAKQLDPDKFVVTKLFPDILDVVNVEISDIDVLNVSKFTVLDNAKFVPTKSFVFKLVIVELSHLSVPAVIYSTFELLELLDTIIVF